MPIHDILDSHAAARPDKPAVHINGRSVSYDELVERSRAFAAYIDTLPGDRSACRHLTGVRKLIALDLGNHPFFPQLFIGATGYPYACAVLDPKMRSAQIDDIVERLRPDLLVTTDRDTPSARAAIKLQIPLLTTGEIDNGKALAAGCVASPRSDTQTYDDTFLVSFTSGTTSTPKAFSRSRASWQTSLERGLDVFDLRRQPTVVCPGPLAHGLALYALIETLHCGGTFHTLARWDANAFAQLLASQAITRVVAVPTMMTALGRLCSPQGRSFPDVREAITAGAKLNPSHMDYMTTLFPNARIREYYGVSELGFVCVSTLRPAAAGTTVDSVGQAFPGVQIDVRDDQDVSLSPGKRGQIHVRSELIADGYLWGRDGQAFCANDGTVNVGDLGELDANGTLKVLGRAGGMVITGGFNVYPSEVEAVLSRIAGISQAIVLGRDDAYLGQRLIAVIQGDCVSLDTVRAQAAGVLPRYKIPREFYRARTWPMTTSGKIARGQVEDLFAKAWYESIQAAT